jgi:hypothetical protein
VSGHHQTLTAASGTINNNPPARRGACGNRSASCTSCLSAEWLCYQRHLSFEIIQVVFHQLVTRGYFQRFPVICGSVWKKYRQECAVHGGYLGFLPVQANIGGA